MGAAGTVLVFTQVPALFAPGFFLLAAAGSCFLAASVAYMAELFPTEIRASLTAFVLVCQVAAGLDRPRGPRRPRRRREPLPAALIMGGCLTTALLALRGLPETTRRDLVREAARLAAPVSA